MSGSNPHPRPLNPAETYFYSQMLRAFRLQHDDMDKAALCLAFAQHEGGDTELATTYNNPFGYKWVSGKDDSRYCYIEKPGNSWDQERGEKTVRYRVFDSLPFAVRSWYWQVFESPSNEDLLPLWANNRDHFVRESYLRWSLNPDHNILALYKDWQNRLKQWKPSLWPF